MLKGLRKGFTLIEMLIVMAVVAILVAIIIPSYRGMQNEAWIAKAEKEVQTLQAAVESYYRHNGAYPAALSDLLAAKPQIITQSLIDPWNTDGSEGYGYQVVNDVTGFGDAYVIYSRSINSTSEVPDAAAIKSAGELVVVLDGDGNKSDDVVKTNLKVTYTEPAS